MIALLLHDQRVLRQPLLYLSLYFKQHRQEYYGHLDTVRSEGDWEGWLDFFLEGVASTAGGAVETAHRLLELFRTDEQTLVAKGRGGAAAQAPGASGRGGGWGCNLQGRVLRVPRRSG
jgi:Fic family protein